MILRVRQCLLVIIVLFQIRNSYLWERLSKINYLSQDVRIPRRSNIFSRKYFDPDLSWIKYGEEATDWALLVNAWLCVQHKKGNGSSQKSKSEKELVIYSYQDFNLTEVSKAYVFNCLSLSVSLESTFFDPISHAKRDFLTSFKVLCSFTHNFN